MKGGKTVVGEIEARERESTGIPKLKVGYNKVFGYFIEVPNSFKGKVPESYIRKHAGELGIANAEFYKDTDIHIHVPEGAVPKDGPSAGVTMVSAIVSELSGRKARCDVAMTGEVTLTGRVLPIGGLREKTMAAYKNGMKVVIIPYDNISDLEECDKTVKEAITFIPVKHVSEVLEVILEPAETVCAKDEDVFVLNADNIKEESTVRV